MFDHPIELTCPASYPCRRPHHLIGDKKGILYISFQGKGDYSMCLIALAFTPGMDRHLLLVANRDEFHERPTRPLAWWRWPEGPLAGRDERAGGTWLAVSRSGRWAAVTNFRDSQAEAGTRSRGELPIEFLESGADPEAHVCAAWRQRSELGPFNLLAGDREQLWYCSTHSEPRAVASGVHALSNGLLDESWPKSRRVSTAMSGLFRRQAESDPERLFELMNDRQCAEDDELPSTGIGLETERLLSPPFIVTPRYGTRCTTIVNLGSQCWVGERRFDARGETQGELQYTFMGGP
jgi:uncharacterized protein with NRDE domain